MNHTLHCHLRKSFSWYHNWHNHPRHQHTHWLLFIVFSITISSFVSSGIGDLYFEHDYIIKTVNAQAGLTITQSGDKFLVNGQSKFLIFASYFYGLGASQSTLNSDFAALKSKGFDGVRVLINWPCGGCSGISTSYRLHNYSDGSYRSGMLARLQNFLQTAQSNNLIIDLTFMDAFDFASFTAYRTALENTARDTISYRNVIFDLQNEADHSYSGGGWTGSVFLPLNYSNTLADAVTAIDPNRLITTSTDASDEPSWVTNSNFDFFAPHAPVRSGDWPGNTDNYVNSVRSELPRVMPIYLQEPERYRGTGQYNDSADDWFTAAKNAKCAGAAGWTFHNDAGYDLVGQTMFSQFNSVENQIVNGLSGQLSSTTWFSCATGTTAPPPPPPQPPTPPLPAPNHAIQFTYYLIDGPLGDFRSEVKSTVGPYLVWGYFWGTKLTDLDAEFQRAVGDGKRIIFGATLPWYDDQPELLGQQLDIAKKYWSSIDWIYFDEPSYSKTQMEAFITDYESQITSRGLALKPIGINFTDTQILTKTGYQATNIDYVGIEAYMDPSFQNDANLVATLNSKIDQMKAAIGNRPIFIVVQAYNRNGNWTNIESLKSIQTPSYLKAYNDTRVNALLFFSYGRSGGTRELHQCIRTEHLRIWNAILGTTQPNSISCSGTVSPPSTLTGPGLVYYIYPDRGPIDTPIIISGKNLSSTITFTDSSGNKYTTTGTLNSPATEVQFTVPPTLNPGNYTVQSGLTLSNPVNFEVVFGSYIQGIFPTEPPVINGFNPTTIGQGETLEINGQFLPPNVQFFDSAGQTTNVLGWTNLDRTLVTVGIPPSSVPGIYTVGVSGGNGSVVSPDVLTIIKAGPDAELAPAALANPTADDFSKLISSVFDYAIMFVGIAVFIMILWAGFLWMTSAANPGNIATAKKMILNAILGAILLLSAYVILYTINPELVGGGFNLPGIEAPAPLPPPPAGPPPVGPPPTGQINACAACQALPGSPYPGNTSSAYQQTLQCVGNYINVIQGTGINLNSTSTTCPYGISEIRLRLILLKSKTDPLGITWVLSEGFPPTVDHKDPGHTNGQAIDIRLSGSANAAQIDQLCLAAKQSNFRVLNEYGITTTNCGSPYSNSNHIHLDL